MSELIGFIPSGALVLFVALWLVAGRDVAIMAIIFSIALYVAVDAAVGASRDR